MKIIAISFGIVVTSLLGIWLYPSPPVMAKQLFEEKYREIASHSYHDALKTLQCSPAVSTSFFSRKSVYRCQIDTACEEPVSQYVFVDRFSGSRIGPDPFYLRFARTCGEILNEGTAARAASSIDQGG